MHRMSALTLSAGMVMMAACSDSPTAPTTSVARVVPRSSFEVLPAPTPAVVLGQLIICKGGNAGGVFDLSKQTIVANANVGSPVVSSVAVANAECKLALEDQNPTDGNGTEVTVERHRLRPSG